MTLALLTTAMSAKQETGETTDVLRLAERAIDLAGGDATKGRLMSGSPLSLAIATRGLARCFRGIAGWKDDFDRAISMAHATEPITRAAAMYFTYIVAIVNGVLSPTASVIREAEEVITSRSNGARTSLSPKAGSIWE